MITVYEVVSPLLSRLSFRPTRPISLPASVAITVNAPAPPQGSITSPLNTVTINASATPKSYPVSRVDFLVGGVLVCSDTTSPYSCNWKVPAAVGKKYPITTNAYDMKGAVGASTVTVTSK